MSKEIWKQIPNWEKYEVSNCGRVRRVAASANLSATVAAASRAFSRMSRAA